MTKGKLVSTEQTQRANNKAIRLAQGVVLALQETHLTNLIDARWVARRLQDILEILQEEP